jgi:hypothetical protein
VETVEYELTDRLAELASGWMDYLEKAFSKINHEFEFSPTKQILLLLTQNPDREWTPYELQKDLKLDMHTHEIHTRLEILRNADLIYGNKVLLRYQGLQDGTFYLILQKRFLSQAELYTPLKLDRDVQYHLKKLKKKYKSLEGSFSEQAGRLAELQLAFEMQSRHHFTLGSYFQGFEEEDEWEVLEVQLRQYVQLANGYKREIDVIVNFVDGVTLLVEVKKHETPATPAMVKAFSEVVTLFKHLHPDQKVLTAFLSLGGFQKKALQLCLAEKMGTATQINYLQTEWD